MTIDTYVSRKNIYTVNFDQLISDMKLELEKKDSISLTMSSKTMIGLIFKCRNYSYKFSNHKMTEFEHQSVIIDDSIPFGMIAMD